MEVLKIVTLMKYWSPSRYSFISIAFCLSIWTISPCVSQTENPPATTTSDTIILANRDKIVGELKQMENGILTVKTSYSESNFKIKWVDVVVINSRRSFLITTRKGHRVNSQIQMYESIPEQVILYENNEIITTTKEDIVYIKPIRNRFISRLDASLSIGFNFTKSNSLSQFNVRSTIGYTAFKWSLESSYNSIRSNQDDIKKTQRIDANLKATYFLEHNWFLQQSSDFLANDEQKLNLRTAFKGGAGKYIVRNNKINFGVGSGLVYNVEVYDDEFQTKRHSVESYVALGLNMFDYENISLYSDIFAYPSLTESNRFRLDFNIDLKYDLPLDFFIKLGFTYNYDSKPVQNASLSDYVFQSTFGWEL